MANIQQHPLYSEFRVQRALAEVCRLHSHQARKDGTPYFAHLLSVTGLVWQIGGTEDEAIAALYHDSIEDVGHKLIDIEDAYGTRVSRIVKGLTEPDKAQDKKQRKAAYIEQVATGDRSIRLVSLCDKLHNAESYLRGATIKADNDSQQDTELTLWFYDQLMPIYRYEFGMNHTYVKQLEDILIELKLLWDNPAHKIVAAVDQFLAQPIVEFELNQ